MDERDEAGQRPEPGPSHGGRWSVDEYVNQLRSFGERALGLVTGEQGSRTGMPSLPPLPSPPGAMSAAQIRAIARSIRAQRQQIVALSEQLAAFDEQLAVLEKLTEPLVEWSSTWAELEGSVADLMRRWPQSRGKMTE